MRSPKVHNLMSTKTHLKLAWAVAAVLAIALAVSLYVIAHPKKDLGTVLQEGSENVTAERDRIKASCNGTTDADHAACQQALSELTRILKEFSKDLEKASPNTPVTR